MSGATRLLTVDQGLLLHNGQRLERPVIAYRTYGALSAAADNAILVCHALTGDQFAGERHPITGKPGWWQHLIGEGAILDTRRFFVLCTNVLGGCMGTTGPASINPATGARYAMDFPVITIADMVQLQKLLVDALGIDRLLCVIGGSMGAMQALQYAVSFPEAVRSCVIIAGASRHSAQNIAFHEVGRQAIMADPDWNGGNYYGTGRVPRRGLAVARMAAHITYLSDRALHRKFGRNLQDRRAVSYGFDADFQVESYLRHQGKNFVDRFDANTYLYVTRAMDYFDLESEYDGIVARAFEGSPVRYCVMSFASDWLFPTAESRALVQAMHAAAANVSFVEIDSDRGHDTFLLREPKFFSSLQGFLEGCARSNGLARASYAVRALPACGAASSAAQREPPFAQIRGDLQIISDMIAANTRVLDIGCGDGSLLSALIAAKAVDGRGMELSQEGVNACVERGLAVIQGNADTDLQQYPDDVFDYVVLSQTLPAIGDPLGVLGALLRIGRRAIVSFPNAGFWRERVRFCLRGCWPAIGGDDEGALPWWATTNIHPCSIRDFLGLVEAIGGSIEQSVTIDARGKVAPVRSWWWANLMARQAVFMMKRNDGSAKERSRDWIPGQRA